MAEYTITADSKPDFDDWGWDEYWSCSEWKEWFMALKAKHGKKNAQDMWIKAWQSQGAFSHALDCRSFNEEFKTFLKNQGLWDGAHSFISKLIAGGTTAVGSTGDAVGSVAEGASDTVGALSKTLKYVIPAVLLIGLIGVSAYAYRTFKS